MKILCSYSSLEFSVEHFPASLYSRESCHPIFHLPQRKLIPYLGKWASGELTPIDSYLLFLATLRSSDLVNFRLPAIRTNRTPTIIAQNMEKLFKAVSHLNTVTSPATSFPSYIIGEGTRDLDNVGFWIDNWEESYQDFLSGKSRDYDDRKLVQREATLQRLIASPHRPISSYASQLADWASVAADFPESLTTHHPSTGLPCTLSDKWKYIIIKCAKQESLFTLDKKDISKILEHCESEIPIGTVMSNMLFRVLRKALEKQQNFLGLGDFDLAGTTYKILNSTDSTEDANLRTMIEIGTNMESPPTPEQYPSKFEYMKAKMRFDMAKKHRATK